MQNIPLTAIKCFEKTTGLNLSYYLYTPVFKSVLLHTEHSVSICVKAKGLYKKVCSLFDGVYVYKNIVNFPDGCLKMCHCGLFEVTIPVIHENQVLAVLNAGVFRVDSETLEQFPVIRNSAAVQLLDISGVDVIGREQLELHFESIRQLAARLTLWYQKVTSFGVEPDFMLPKEKLLYIIQHEARNGLTLGKLAKILNLSYSRCAHLVKETCGESFAVLIQKYRLEYACTLLEHSNNSIEMICRRSGFRNLAHFHRVFKAEIGMSPLKYRNNPVKRNKP